MIHVVAYLTTHPGEREAVLKEYRAVVETVRAEAGCIEYAAFIDVEGFGSFQTPLGPDGFFVLEKWESAAALKAHARTPHMADYVAKTKDKIATRAIHILTPA